MTKHFSDRLTAHENMIMDLTRAHVIELRAYDTRYNELNQHCAALTAHNSNVQALLTIERNDKGKLDTELLAVKQDLQELQEIYRMSTAGQGERITELVHTRTALQERVDALRRALTRTTVLAGVGGLILLGTTITGFLT